MEARIVVPKLWLLTTNLRCVTSQKSEGVITPRWKPENHAKFRFSCPRSVIVANTKRECIATKHLAVPYRLFKTTAACSQPSNNCVRPTFWLLARMVMVAKQNTQNSLKLLWGFMKEEGSHSTRFLPGTPEFLGFKDHCPSVPQISLLGSKIFRGFQSHEHRTLL
jgi:hypothetical protein